MRGYLVLAGLIAAVLISGSACSLAEQDGGDSGDGGGDKIIKASRPRDIDTETVETDGGLGEAVKVGSISIRVFDVRFRDRVYAVSGPGEEAVTKGGGSGEFVAVDFVAQNVSGSPLTTKARATLVDDRGDAYEQGVRIEPPANGLDGMELGTGQRRASTVFFRVPNGISPERLEVRTPNDVARIDLLDTHPGKIPPEDYLRVFHAYLNERAYEEAYEMLDPASVQEITLGEWLSFFEPLWGERYFSLDGIKRVYVGGDGAAFDLERTLYDEDGDPVPDPEIDASVSQELVRDGDEWRLVMGDELASDIIAVIGPDQTPEPEATTPEATAPETTIPETTQPPETTVPESTALENTTEETTAAETTVVADEAPEEVLASQYELVNAGAYGAAYDLFDSRSRQLVSREQYAAYFAARAPYEITGYSFSSVQVQGETATVVVDLVVSSSGGDESYTVAQPMVSEGGSWRTVMRDEQVAAFTAAG